MDFMDDFDGDDFGGLLISDGTKDEHERKFMNVMNFTDEMYEVIQDDGSDASMPPHPCMDSMYEVGRTYRSVHGYISLLVCIAGILMNILIIMVLTRKEMCTPINRMLTALAIADMLVMIEYIPFTLHMYILERPNHERFSYAWAVFVLFHSHFTQIVHTINIQLTITMSIWRYVALKGSGKTSNYLTFSRCNLLILLAYTFPVIVCIPNYLTFSIYHFERLYLKTPFHFILKRKEVSHMKNFLELCRHASTIMRTPMDCEQVVVKQDWYTVGLSRLAKANNELLHRINFWIFSVFVKLIPCVVLTFFMCWLVNALYKTKRRYKMLQTTKQLATVLEAAEAENNSFTRMKRVRCNSAHAHNGSGNGGALLAVGVLAGTDIGSENSSMMMQEVMLLSPELRKEQRQQRLSCPNTHLEPNRLGVDHDHQETTNAQLCGGGASPSPGVSSSFLHPLQASPNTSILTMNGSCSNIDNNGVSISVYGSTSQINAEVDADPASGNNEANNASSGNAPGGSGRQVIKKKFSRRNLTRVSSLRKGRCHRESSASATGNGNGNTQAGCSQGHAAAAANAAAIARNNSKKVVKRTDRTSKLLIAVLCLFLITEIPQGIMAFLSGVYGEQFFKKCYNTWAEVWDILALINSAINFILYCFMSRQFRLQFHLLFQLRRWFRPKWINGMTNCNLHQTISTTV